MNADWFDNEGRDSDCRQATRAALACLARVVAVALVLLILFAPRF